MKSSHWRPPQLSLRCLPVWRRNFLVWRKLALPSILGNLADPALYMLGLGYGLGSLMPSIDGASYIHFLAAGTVCYSTMNSATFESLYSAFSRMHVQRTWDAILNAPLNLDDVLVGEALWAASKSLLSGCAILLIAALLGLVASPLALWVIPLAFFIGLCFAGLALVMNAVSPSYDFFLYYFTLVVTPMTLLCGVFFPVSQLPPVMQQISAVLPLTHAVEVVRPLMAGRVPEAVGLHLLALAAYGGAGFYVALALTRRRLLS